MTDKLCFQNIVRCLLCLNRIHLEITLKQKLSVTIKTKIKQMGYEEPIGGPYNGTAFSTLPTIDLNMALLGIPTEVPKTRKIKRTKTPPKRRNSSPSPDSKVIVIESGSVSPTIKVESTEPTIVKEETPPDINEWGRWVNTPPSMTTEEYLATPSMESEDTTPLTKPMTYARIAAQSPICDKSTRNLLAVVAPDSKRRKTSPSPTLNAIDFPTKDTPMK